MLLTQWTTHVDLLAEKLRAAGRDPVVLRGGMGARKRVGALDQLRPEDGPLLVVATGPYVGEGFDCAALDTVFLAAPIAFKGRLVQYVGRILRPYRAAGCRPDNLPSWRGRAGSTWMPWLRAVSS